MSPYPRSCLDADDRTRCGETLTEFPWELFGRQQGGCHWLKPTVRRAGSFRPVRAGAWEDWGARASRAFL